MPEIIRLGDSTSHGGKVIEGSPFDICMGKPIAYFGHKVQCPKCKGVFPIVEGAPTTTFYGKGVALAGMKTACGAVLIASQFTDIVEFGGGSAAAGNASKITNSTAASPAASSASDTPSTKLDCPDDKHDCPDDKFDDRFILQDADTGEPIPFGEYAIRRESGEIEYGTTDADGRTHLLSATAKAELIEIYA